jgi:two-component system chemotaxis sensor kinase CheA
MDARDDDLRAILLEEVVRREEEAFASDEPQAARRVAHALKGTLGLAGEREASESFARVERRIAAGDPEAIADLRRAITGVRALLEQGAALPSSTWPEPPHDLAPSAIDNEELSHYLAAVHDRLSRIDAVLGGETSPDLSVREIYREVHTIKGAALATGDEVMAWFCHGLEERLRVLSNTEEFARALEEVEAHRGIIAEVATAPAHALSTLRIRTVIPQRPSQAPLALPLPPRRPLVDSQRESEARELSADASVRVSSALLDSLFERATQLSPLRSRLVSGSDELASRHSRLAEYAAELREALRLIGPPKPWGAPARALKLIEGCADGLATAAEDVRSVALDVREISTRIARDGEALTSSVHALRTSDAATLFERLIASGQSEARHQGKSIEFVQVGGEVRIDRKLIEGLVEPLRQVIRNSVVHGIESAEERELGGKRTQGTVSIRAWLDAGTLHFTIEDDGRGVDIAAVRERALAARLGVAEEVSTMSEHEVLDLLFLPGFSLRDAADLVAGRGVGLDLAHAAVERLGGTIQLRSEHGRGLQTTLGFPAEGTLVRVVWLRSGGQSFALTVRATGRVLLPEEAGGPPALSTLLRRTAGLARSRLALEVVPLVGGVEPVFVGVDEVGAIEEVAVRPIPPLARSVGPYSAAVAFGDELRLVLDPMRLAQRHRRWMQ